jgi:hypothetical protein
MKLEETKDEVFYRFERAKRFWFELAYVKARKRFLAFRCNVFDEDPDWVVAEIFAKPTVHIPKVYELPGCGIN